MTIRQVDFTGVEALELLTDKDLRAHVRFLVNLLGEVIAE